MVIRKIEHSIEILPDEGDEALAQAILAAWSDDLGDLIVATPRPEGWHQIEGKEGDEEDWWPHGYGGYGFLFSKGKLYVAFVIPKAFLRETSERIEIRSRLEAKVRHSWEKVAQETQAQAQREDDADTSDDAPPTPKPNEPKEDQH